jgi:carbonic anhydrase/acetyltransferase-like protein (isoleucine patch superfamily)
MAFILSVLGIKPTMGENCFLAPNATIIGDVQMGNNCSVWFNAVIRGDVHSIRIGHNTNIQDGAIIHCTYKKAGTYIGDNVSVAHNAIVHGCTIHNHALIGMGAIVMDNAIVGEGAVVAAGSVVLQNSVLEAGYIYAGSPVKKIKPVPEEMARSLAQTALNYLQYPSFYTDLTPEADNHTQPE